jgi:hypothetical protein
MSLKILKPLKTLTLQVILLLLLNLSMVVQLGKSNIIVPVNFISTLFHVHLLLIALLLVKDLLKMAENQVLMSFKLMMAKTGEMFLPGIILLVDLDLM